MAKYTRPKRSTIGKQSPDDPLRMYPNQNFLKYFPDIELPMAFERDRRSSCLKVGFFIVIRKIMEQTGIPEILGKHFKEPDRGLLLDLAAYSIISENNAGQYYPDYAYCHPLFTHDMALYSDSTVSDFFHRVTEDQRQGFLNEWNKKKDHRDGKPSTSHTILRISAVRPEKWILRSMGMQRMISQSRSSIIRLYMTRKTVSLYSMKSIREVLMMYPNCR